MVKSISAAYRATRLLIIVAILIFLASGVTWWWSERTDPQRVFEAMLNNNLRTTSVTRSVLQSENGQTLDQDVRFQAAAKQVAVAETALSQSDEQGTQTARVVTENIGTPLEGYIRYTEIETVQQSVDGGDLNFEDVLNVWGKVEPQEGLTTGELYNEIALGAIPFGYINSDERKALLEFIKEENVYQIDYSSVTSSELNGREVYVYNVRINPQSYISLLKEYASAVGLTQLDEVDPAAYANSQALNLEVTVDVLTQRLASITYPNGRTETYGNYGVIKQVTIPESTISVEELQSRVQSVQ